MSIPRRRLHYILASYILPILCSLILIGLLGFKFLTYFYTLPFITGYDNPTHAAMIDVYRKDIFPSLWGWMQNWYAGMPVPLFYPPVGYYIGVLVQYLFESSVTAYKFTSIFSVATAIVVAFIILRKIFFKDIDPGSDLKADKLSFMQYCRYYFDTLKRHTPLILAIAAIFSLNPGAPSIQAISDGILGHQFAMIFLIIGVYCFTKKTPFHTILAIISWTLMTLSNTHAMLAGSVFLFFYWILYPFAYNKIERLGIFLKHTSRITIVGISTILLSACWLFPMIGFYRYFTGIHTLDAGLSNRFFLACSAIVLISAISIFIANYEDRKKLRQFYLSIFATFGFLLTIEIIQRSFNTNLGLPIQLWRWYETICFLCVIPLCHVLIFTMKRLRYVGLLLLLSLCIVTGAKHVNWHAIYYDYTLNQTSKLIEKVIAETPKNDLTLVHGRGYPTFTTLRQITIDANLGAAGANTMFSNLRESSINAIYFRIAKSIVSRAEENWALINYTQARFSKKNNLENHVPLLNLLGIEKIILAKDDLTHNDNDIDITQLKSYTIDSSLQSFIVLTSKKDISRAVEIEGPLTLVFAEDGFRDRKNSDTNWSRLQETSFEKGLYRKTVIFAAADKRIEKNEDAIMRSKYIIIANLETDNPDQMIRVLENALKDRKRKIFIFSKDSDAFRAFSKRFIRNEQVIFVSIRNQIFPFDEVATSIIKSETKNLQEKNLKIEFNDNNKISIAYEKADLKSQLLKDSKIKSTATKKTSAEIDVSKTRIWFIRQSYFPAWKAVGVGKANLSPEFMQTYLANPGFTMLFPEDKLSVSLYLETPKVVINGHIISLITLFGILGYSLGAYAFTIRRKNRQTHHHSLEN